MEKQTKKFTLGNLKKYALVAIASVTLMGAPAQAHAQEKNKADKEVFNLQKASDRDKVLYAAIVDVLAVKFPAEEASYRAAKIMSGMSQFNEAQGNVYVRFMVEQMMGAEFKDQIEKAKREVDGPAANTAAEELSDDAKIRARFSQKNLQTDNPDRDLRKVQTNFGALYYELQPNGEVSNCEYDRQALSENNRSEIAEIGKAITENIDKHAVRARTASENLAYHAIVENIIFQDIKARQAQGEKVSGGQEFMKKFETSLADLYGLDLSADGKLVKRDYDKDKKAAPATTVTKDKFGTEEKTVTVADGVTTTTTKSEKVFKITSLTPEELLDYNTMLAKIKVSRELRGQNDAGTMMLAQNAFMSSENRDKLFDMYVGGVKFRDLDDASFVAFNPKTGQGKIHARGDVLSQAKKQIKKAGGIENFVMSVQKTKTKAPKTTGKIPLKTLDGNIH